MAASDESFGDKENLLNPGAALFQPGRYGNRGEIVDGWETRRRREPGHDWALVRLGSPGQITSIDVDTSFFTGNFPESCQVEACGREGYPSPAELNQAECDWTIVVPRSPLGGDRHNTFPVSDSRRFTHIRLSIFPDGGVARLRVFGRVIPDPRPFDSITIDLANQQHGGVVIASSDGFYTSAELLIRPDSARTMGEGWETRRRRDSGHDFVIFQLAFVGIVQQLIVDTAHFKYNATDETEVFGCADEVAPSVESPGWTSLLGRTRLQPDTCHVFRVDYAMPVGSIRMDAFPDGGISRVRVVGRIEIAARCRAGYRWFNALPSDQAATCLMDAGLPRGRATEIVQLRPLDESWLTRSSLAGEGQGMHLRELGAILEGRREGTT